MQIVIGSLALLWVLSQTLVLGLYLSRIGIPATWEWFWVPTPTYFLVLCVVAFFLIVLGIGLFSALVDWAHKRVENRRRKEVQDLIDRSSVNKERTR